MKQIEMNSDLRDKNSYISKSNKSKKSHIKYCKYIILLALLSNFPKLFSQYYIQNTFMKKEANTKELIEKNFFVLDSNNLEKIQSIMYGYSVSKKGILTNNYYRKLGYYEKPDPQGVYVMIRKIGEEIRIDQDFYGGFGLYIFENKNTGYFALSNSFLLLEEYLIGKQNFTFNKEFSDNLIISYLSTASIYETTVNEINLIPSNAFIVLNIKKKTLNIHYIDYKENSVPFESEESFKIIDKWVDKWSYILHSLKKQTNNIKLDLSGGFDTRSVLAILLNSGIDMNEILVNSINDTLYTHEEDFKIASYISKIFGFKLNNLILNTNGTNLSIKDSILLTIYTKLGFHKELYLNTKFFFKPIFRFTGNGGESVRRLHYVPIKKYIEEICSNAKEIKGHHEEFYNSSLRLCNRSIALLKQKKKYNNDYEITEDFYYKGEIRHHYGKAALELFLVNQYTLHPLIDPDIHQIKLDINKNSAHDLVAYIYVRFAHDLAFIPFERKRELNQESVKKAEKLNKKLHPYKIKSNYNENFYIDIERNFSGPSSKEKYPNEYLRKIFKSQKFINIINQIYDKNIYKWAKEYSKNYKFFPLRHGYGLFAVAKTLEDLSINKRYYKNLDCKNSNKG